METAAAETWDLPVARADRILQKLQDVREWAQSAMVAGQQRQEEGPNRKRDKATLFRVGDKVWLDLSKIKTVRPCKKLDAKHAKFTVLATVGLHAYRLDTPSGVHNVFPMRCLRLASRDTLPGQ